MNHEVTFVIGALAGALALTTDINAQSIFSDDFTSGASPLWVNERGNWGAQSGVYNAQAPNNNPATYTSLPFVLTDFTLTLKVNQISDGGIWLQSDAAGLNGILLVTGGEGWGLGSTGPNAGSSLYWHVITNGVAGPKQQEVFNAFTAGDDIVLSVTATGNTYSAFVNGILKSTFVDTTYPSGRVALYDFSPGGAVNQTINQTFDNVTLSVPEPTSLALLSIGAACLTLSRRKSAHEVGLLGD